MSDKTEPPTPSPLYPCKHCSSDYSWPASDLFWSASEKAWVCTGCWDNYEEAKGISLAAELANHPDSALRVALGAGLENLIAGYDMDGTGNFVTKTTAEQARALMEAALAQPQDAKGEEKKDGERLDFIEHNTVTLEVYDIPTGGDDADIAWRVIEYHMGKKGAVEIGWGTTARAAIDSARSREEGKV